MDRIIRATAGDGAIKMAVINARDTVERARQIHGCAPTACAALGRTLCAASLMGQDMKEENAALTIRINGNGPLGGIGKLNVGAAVGRDGMFTVSRDIGMREPYIGSVELVSGEIAEDLTAYLLESEQVPSACALGVLVDTDCTVKAAGGFIVQLMPGAEEEIISRLEDNIFMMDQLTTILSEDGEEELFRQVLKGFDYHTVGEHPIEYRCYCSRERVLDALRCVSAEELEEIAAEGKDVSVSCQFCDKVYDFTPDELREINTPEKT